ncbi:hypothetical protein Cni_G13997 [Canna indica]|uniref:RNase H type-1 domain-containing protein n=1 Tax=Canna indica TaxID=4628 RepID=A0AAQ3KD47_9LILI|nr:hypothetical protein Cni_G13997 [Canna indica]
MSKKSSQGARLLVASLLLFLFFAGLTALILYLVYRPSRPRFSISAAAIYTLSNASSNTSSSPAASSLSTSMQFTLITRNPSGRGRICYDRLSAYVSYHGHPITPPAPLPPMFQDSDATVAISPVLGSGCVPAPEDVVAGLAAEQAYGVVGLRLVLRGRLRYKSGPFRSRWHGMYVRCDMLVGLRKGGGGAVPLLGDPGCDVDVKVEAKSCFLCKKEADDLEHLFFNCSFTYSFWEKAEQLIDFKFRLKVTWSRGDWLNEGVGLEKLNKNKNKLIGFLPAGFIARDADSRILFEISEFKFTESPIFAEVWAIELVVGKAMEMNLSGINVHSDCQVAIKMLNCELKTPWSLKSLISDILEAATKIIVYNWVYISRACNTEAHALAKKGLLSFRSSSLDTKPAHNSIPLHQVTIHNMYASAFLLPTSELDTCSNKKFSNMVFHESAHLDVLFHATVSPEQKIPANASTGVHSIGTIVILEVIIDPTAFVPAVISEAFQPASTYMEIASNIISRDNMPLSVVVNPRRITQGEGGSVTKVKKVMPSRHGETVADEEVVVGFWLKVIEYTSLVDENAPLAKPIFGGKTVSEGYRIHKFGR